MLRRVIQVHSGQDDKAAGDRVGQTMHRTALATMIQSALPGALAPTTGALKPDTVADRLPILWIPGAVFRADRHGAKRSWYVVF